MSRYARQMILPQVGDVGQARLAAAHVLVVGAGGLAVPVLHYLAGAGIGRITVVDADRIKVHNLHRQPLYRMDQLGQPKARAAADALASLNPEVTVRPVTEWLTPANAPALVGPADLVLDCADTFAASLTLSDCCLAAGKPLVSASALGLSGYVGGFCGAAPSMRAVFPDLPASAATCDTAGVLGPVVGLIGALQAQMALAVLLDLSPSPLGQMMVVDASGWRVSDFRFDAAPEPPAPLPFIDADAVSPHDMVIDLRTEAPSPCRAGALHMPASMLSALQLPPAGEMRVVLACRTGLRAHNAGQGLRARWAGDIALLSVPDG